jgi:hypothetical protein
LRNSDIPSQARSLTGFPRFYDDGPRLARCSIIPVACDYKHQERFLAVKHRPYLWASKMTRSLHLIAPMGFLLLCQRIVWVKLPCKAKTAKRVQLVIAKNSAIHRFQTPSYGEIRDFFLHVLQFTSEIVGFKYPGNFYGVLLNFLDSHHLGRHHRQSHGCRATSYDINLVGVNFGCISVANVTKNHSGLENYGQLKCCRSKYRPSRPRLWES